MILIDASVLLNAVNKASPLHKPVVHWFREVFDGSETIGLPWISLWAFARIATNARVFPAPKSAAEVFEQIEAWIGQPGVMLIQPGTRHGQLLRSLVERHRVAGPLMSDAVVAAIALEHGAAVASTDGDFARFREVRWVNPAAIDDSK